MTDEHQLVIDLTGRTDDGFEHRAVCSCGEVVLSLGTTATVARQESFECLRAHGVHDIVIDLTETAASSMPGSVGKQSAAMHDEVRRLWEAGLSVPVIAARLRLSQSTVYRWFRQLDRSIHEMNNQRLPVDKRSR